MPIRTPASRAELLLLLARFFTESDLGVPVSVGVLDHTDGYVDLAVSPLLTSDPVGSIFGFDAPANWCAFGVASAATAAPCLRDGVQSHVCFAYLVDREGTHACAARDQHSNLTVFDYVGASAELGRIPDACRRVLRLPTPPPALAPRTYWILEWLDRILALAIGRDLGSPPPPWNRIEALLRIESDDTHPWAILRRQCAAGHLDIGGISPRLAAWMDDGMFSREAIGAFPEPQDMVADLAELMPPHILERIVERLERSG